MLIKKKLLCNVKGKFILASLLFFHFSPNVLIIKWVQNLQGHCNDGHKSFFSSVFSFTPPLKVLV